MTSKELIKKIDIGRIGNGSVTYNDICLILNKEETLEHLQYIEQLEKENQELKETLNKTRKMGLEITEEKEQLSNELHKLNCYRNIELNEISKLKKVLDILKENFPIKFLGYNKYGAKPYEIMFNGRIMGFDKEKYELLKEVFGDDK